MSYGGRPPRAAPDPTQKAMELLVRREHSRRDLKRKLGLRGADPAEAEAAVEKLAGLGYQDDDRFGASFARDRAASGYGPVRIRQELAGHGLSGDQVQNALDQCETDWAASARSLVDKRFRPEQLADPARRRKAVDFLLRRGFDPNCTYAAVRARPDDEFDAIE
ncbi:MAG: recombination regulator RecX [Lysobacteraceae bacterium]|nr:MAG: recombination regulator RecX [Xanthomonadaceae bacterium]